MAEEHTGKEVTGPRVNCRLSASPVRHEPRAVSVLLSTPEWRTAEKRRQSKTPTVSPKQLSLNPSPEEKGLKNAMNSYGVDMQQRVAQLEKERKDQEKRHKQERKAMEKKIQQDEQSKKNELSGLTDSYATDLAKNIKTNVAKKKKKESTSAATAKEKARKTKVRSLIVCAAKQFVLHSLVLIKNVFYSYSWRQNQMMTETLMTFLQSMKWRRSEMERESSG